MPSVADVVAGVVQENGVRTVFGLLGEANLAIALALRDNGCEWLAMRREDSVVAAAEGFAQGAGGVGVATVSQGPALANAMNPLIGAVKGRSPLVLITGALPDSAREAPQWWDQSALAAATGTPFLRISEATAAQEITRLAFDQARSGTPVILEVPTHLQHASAGPPADAAGAQPAQDSSYPYDGTSPDPAEIAQAATWLSVADRPVVLAGHAAIGCRDQLIQIADGCGAVLATTLKAKGLFNGHPRDVGVAGGFGNPTAQELLDRADTALVAGASLNAFTTRGGVLFAGARVVRVEALPGDPAVGSSELRVTGGVLEVLREIVGELPPGSDSCAPDWPVDPSWKPAAEPDQSDASGLDLRTVSRFLDASLPADRALSTDLGYFTSEPAIAIEVRHPRRLSFPLHFGSIGLGLASAIGLSSSDASVPTLCVVGDGGLCAALGELETLSRTTLPIVVAVYNDSAYGVEVHELRYRGQDTALARFPHVDFAAVAEALGIEAFRASSRAELEALTPALARPHRPVLLDFTLNPDIVTAWYRQYVHPATAKEQT